jgi:hypothetical protein
LKFDFLGGSHLRVNIPSWPAKLSQGRAATTFWWLTLVCLDLLWPTLVHLLCASGSPLARFMGPDTLGLTIAPTKQVHTTEQQHILAVGPPPNTTAPPSITNCNKANIRGSVGSSLFWDLPSIETAYWLCPQLEINQGILSSILLC